MTADLGAAVRRERLTRGLTQGQLAEQIGLSVGALRDLEQGRTRDVRPPARDRLLVFVHEGRTSVRVLGPLEVVRGPAPVGIGSPAQRTVLAALALTPGQWVHRDQIGEILWPDWVPGQPAGMIHTYVSRLRRLIDAAPARWSADSLIRHDQGRYRLELAPDQSDLLAFRYLVASARRRKQASVAAQRYRRALDLWRGEPLIELPRLDSYPPLADVRREHAAAVVEYAVLCADKGTPMEAVGVLEALVRADPFHEQAHALLMGALTAGGEPRRAGRVYQALRARLADELGVTPGQAVERSYAATVAAGRVTSALPADVASFTGRRSELAELLSLTSGGVAVITGIGGVGKTALAVHAAHQLAEHYPGGQVFVDLHGFSETLTPAAPAAVLESVLHAAGHPVGTLPDGVRDRAALWRAESRRPSILVLDSAVRADQVRALLPPPPGTLILITARTRLPIGANVVQLDPMPAPEAAELFVRLAGDRAARTGELDELIRLCGGLPLTVAMATARLRWHPMWTAEHQLGLWRRELERIDEPTLLSGVFEMTWRRLPAASRALLSGLAALPLADIDGYAAAAVLGIDPLDAEAVLEDLADMHLLASPRPGRYALHDLVHAYCAQRHPTDPPIEPLMAYYRAALAEAADPSAAAGRLPDLSTPDKARRWADTERANVLATVRLACERGTVGACDLALLLNRNLFFVGRFDDLREIHELALTVAGDDHRAALLNTIGVVHHHQGRADRAMRAFQAALDCARTAGQTGQAAAALDNIGHALERSGDLAGAAQRHREALDMALAVGDTGQVATIRSNLAVALHGLGRLDEALALQRQSLAYARQVGDGWNEARRLTCLGRVLTDLGRHTAAIASQRAAVEGARRLGDLTMEAADLCDLAASYRAASRDDLALSTLRQAVPKLRATGNRHHLAYALRMLSELGEDAA